MNEFPSSIVLLLRGVASTPNPKSGAELGRFIQLENFISLFPRFGVTRFFDFNVGWVIPPKMIFLILNGHYAQA